MIIVHPDFYGNHDRARGLTNRHRILMWLGTWRYSTIPVMRELVGSKSPFYRALRSLESDELIYSAKLENFISGGNYYALTRKGHKILEYNAREPGPFYEGIPGAQMIHDMKVQIIALNYIDGPFDMIFADFRSRFQPDFSVCGPGGLVSVEYERSRKSINRVYYNFRTRYLEAAERSAVQYHWYFEHKRDLDWYRGLFDQKFWPVIEKSEHDTCFDTCREFRPDTTGSRDCFRFFLRKEDAPDI